MKTNKKSDGRVTFLEFDIDLKTDKVIPNVDLGIEAGEELTLSYSANNNRTRG